MEGMLAAPFSKERAMAKHLQLGFALRLLALGNFPTSAAEGSLTRVGAIYSTYKTRGQRLLDFTMIAMCIFRGREEVLWAKKPLGFSHQVFVRPSGLYWG